MHPNHQTPNRQTPNAQTPNDIFQIIYSKRLNSKRLNYKQRNMEAQRNDPIVSRAMNGKAPVHAKSHTTFKGYVSHTGESFEAENLEDLYAEIKNHIPINLLEIVDDRPDDWERRPMGHGKRFYYWMVKLKERNELGNDYDYYLRGERSGTLGLGLGLPLIELDFRQEKAAFIASCDAEEEKKHWYDDVLTNDEHLTHGYLEITKMARVPTPVAPVVASRKRGAPTPQLGPDVAPDVAPGVDSTRKRAKTVVEVPAAEVRRHQHATRRVREYHMLRIQNVAKLNEQVNKMMKEGWQPYYGPCIEKFFTNQVMVKYELNSLST